MKQRVCNNTRTPLTCESHSAGLLLAMLVAALLFLSACEHRELSADDGCAPEIPVKVEIIWSADDSVPAPGEGMRIHLFNARSGSASLFDRGPYGGLIRLPLGSSWLPLTYDYQRMENLGFRNEENPDRFEAYSIPVYSSTYRTRVDLPPGEEEPTVEEAYPYRFYVGRNEEPFTVTPPPKGDTLRLRYYPENVLREFTFLITGVEGAANIGSVRGAISGMSGSYYPYTRALSSTPSTVFFRRVTPIEDGRWYGWEWLDNPYVLGEVPVYPQWFPPGWGAPVTGWNGDWLVGAFSVFGPVDTGRLNNILTIEVLSRGNQHYSAGWGYRDGVREDIVRRQIAGALSDPDWREKNGGFDIILQNDGRLVIPLDVGLNTDVQEWDDVPVPLTW